MVAHEDDQNCVDNHHRRHARHVHLNPAAVVLPGTIIIPPSIKRKLFHVYDTLRGRASDTMLAAPLDVSYTYRMLAKCFQEQNNHNNIKEMENMNNAYKIHGMHKAHVNFVQIFLFDLNTCILFTLFDKNFLFLF